MNSPVKELMQRKGWNYSDLATAAGVCNSTIYKNICGSSRKVNASILNLVEELGEDPQKFSNKYQEFKAAKRKELINQ